MKKTNCKFAREDSIFFDSTISAVATSSSNRGNFIELLNWASTTDPVVQSILENSSGNATYHSPIIQNELLHEMANNVREQISEKVCFWTSIERQ